MTDSLFFPTGKLIIQSNQIAGFLSPIPQLGQLLYSVVKLGELVNGGLY